MAARQSSVLLTFLAWALLNLKAEVAGANAACEKHLQYLASKSWKAPCLSEPQPFWNWLQNMVGLGVLCAVVIALFSPFYSTGATDSLCAQEGCPESCPDANEIRVPPCGSPNPACIWSQGQSGSPMLLEIQHTYAQKLTRMERQLEEFLVEVRSQRHALEEVLGGGCRGPQPGLSLQLTVDHYQ